MFVKVDILDSNLILFNTANRKDLCVGLNNNNKQKNK